MPSDPKEQLVEAFIELLRASQDLLEKRRDQMLTAAEWERLQATTDEAERTLVEAILDQEKRGG